MNTEIKERWLKALRSGKYKQARGVLRKKRKDGSGEFGYCCLGVLCDTIKPEGWATDQNSDQHIMGGEGDLYSGVKENLWLTHKEVTDLIERNDGYQAYKRHNFLQIADYIEKNL